MFHLQTSETKVLLYADIYICLVTTLFWLPFQRSTLHAVVFKFVEIRQTATKLEEGCWLIFWASHPDCNNRFFKFTTFLKTNYRPTRTNPMTNLCGSLLSGNTIFNLIANSMDKVKWTRILEFLHNSSFPAKSWQDPPSIDIQCSQPIACQSWQYPARVWQDVMNYAKNSTVCTYVMVPVSIFIR